MTIHAPQIIWFVLVGIMIGRHTFMDGKPCTDKYSCARALFNALTTFGLLYWGGFFG
jgi:hypothetical protein